MKLLRRECVLGSGCALVLMAWSADVALAAQVQEPQSRQRTLDGPPARAPDKVYALTGYWDSIVPGFGLLPPGLVPFQPEYAQRLLRMRADDAAGKPIRSNETYCIPNGMPMHMSYGFEIFASAERITVLRLTSLQVRYIWIDGRAHSSDAERFDTYAGESIGHWEGDTLVIDTTGLLSANELRFGIPADSAMHVVERWRLREGKLEIVTTVEDPTMLTEPWTSTNRYVRRPLRDIQEVQYCVSATDRTMKTGVQGLDLTPPQGGYVPPGAGE